MICVPKKIIKAKKSVDKAVITFYRVVRQFVKYYKKREKN